MTGYQTVGSGTATEEASGEDMAHPRRSRNPKLGGGHASMLSSNINLLNTIVGAGTLAMPAAMSHFGVMLGVLLIVWCGLTSAFGLYLQGRCARYLDRGTSSFFALSQITYPNAAVVFDAAIAIKCFGVGVSYMIIIGDLMPGVAEAFGSIDSGLSFLDDRRFWITVFFVLFIIPLSFPKRLDSLKYTSMVALLAIGYLILLVVYHFAADEIPNDRDIRIITWEGPAAALRTLPVVIFAYTCHQNMFSIVNEIKDNSPGSIVGVIVSSIGSAASVYILVAITGYLTFGNAVKGNIVGMYPPSIASTIAKAAIVALVTFSIPLQIHPCRASIDAVLRWRPGNNSRSTSPSRATGPASGHQPLLPSSSSPAAPSPPALDSHGSPAAAMSEMRFALITSTILVLSYVTALHVSTLDRVLAYVGSTGSTAISFILPGLFYYKISDPDSTYHQRLSKEDDDAGLDVQDDRDANDEDEDDEAVVGSGLLAPSVASLRSTASTTGSGGRGIWRWRRKWRWDLEHLDTGLLRKLSLCLSMYGVCVMVVCLGTNAFFSK
ncbi:transmembrane amino acid transporter protein-domain-containing protein [Dichotomopilus funicola]|uniref:Transmembrane amino acid transporter protein-domain-containing protein n=1 Tax=Dichotomopilus funicola TaxID=1934379 RepID=A0AAN6UVN5_9PEZI|nr:transmembrane amino acid transporter protein-domain-containing protein [Dichotomopilus funicola]